MPIMNGLSSSISATTLSTPIPTPPTVRFISSALIAAAVAVLTTSLAREIQVIALLISTGAAFLVLFSHPYRKEIRTFLEKRNMHYTPKFAQVVPLFFVWLALMLAPLLAPAPPLLDYRHHILDYFRMDVANIPACRRHQSTGVRRHATTYVTFAVLLQEVLTNNGFRKLQHRLYIRQRNKTKFFNALTHVSSIPSAPLRPPAA